MDQLSIYDHEKILEYLDDESLKKLILVSESSFNAFRSSPQRLRRFSLKIGSKNFKHIRKSEIHNNVNYRNISISVNKFIKLKNIVKLLSRYKDSLEILEINNLKFLNIQKCQELFNGLNNLKCLKLVKCNVENLNSEKLNPIRTLKEISFNKCSDNIFKVFTNQESFEKITVINNDWTWNGFPHDIFYEICKTSKNLVHIVLEGAGTGSYFDSDEFPFKITKLKTSMVTFHWYVGIRTQRIKFFESQKRSLKELTIHQLPYDFDGGRVLKYIIEEMKLEKFYYGKIPLILNGQKQEVTEFEASEIQITSAFEMVGQFPSIEKFTLKISNTDVSSDAIEKIINPTTTLFKNIKEFEVTDMSSYRGLFGVFLGLFKNLKNVRQLTLRTQDRNINTILECLPIMHNLQEIQLTSTAPRALERYQIILKLTPNLSKIFISSQSLNEAALAFELTNVAIFDIENSRRYCRQRNQELTRLESVTNTSVIPHQVIHEFNFNVLRNY